ncbi:cation transporter [Leptospira langatensis]|uniref:Cation transporter n=1 Tax=Leptospira langatensis TaxID=2484983 RepID=A0A5F1ZZZ9_9LEPT|nr:cation diffusion facilitator family transporter [Leptospira langatensis]TGK04153.1 cation transporter [Leptospira langatensis]TGL43633.1 cation transporter [Leptospira langatensis]
MDKNLTTSLSNLEPFLRQAILRPKRKDTIRTLVFAFLLSILIFSWEIFGSAESKSLALLADAGHVISDSFAFLLSIFAVWISDRKPTSKMNFGFFRVEVFAAFCNSILISGISIYIIIEAIHRFQSHHDIAPDSMLVFSLGTIALNLLSVWLLKRIAADNINLRSAYLHVLSDLLGTLAVLAGAILIRFVGWVWIDPLISLLLSIIILRSAVIILKESILILLEASPTHEEWDHLKKDILEIEGVENILSAHTWTLTKGIHASAFRLQIASKSDPKMILKNAYELLRGEWKFEQIYLQLEDPKTTQTIEGIVAKTLHDIDSEEWGHHHHTHDHPAHHHSH